ncbi:MAG: diguanylate cyclase [Spirochaetales bacterium]|nr:diguanylate cyclase [Spirochaetales bacterium]
MSVYAIISITTSITIAFWSGFIYSKNPKSKVNILFFLLSLTFAYWSFTEFVTRYTDSADTAYLWLKLNFQWSFSAALLLHLVLVFTDNLRKKYRLYIVTAMYLPALFFSIIDISTDYILGKVVKHIWGWTYTGSDSFLFYLATIWAVILPLLAIIICIQKYRRSKSIKMKKQLGFLIVGSCFPLLLGSITDGIFPIFHIVTPGLTSVGFFFGIFFIGYAVLKHGLFDITPEEKLDIIMKYSPDIIVTIDRDATIKYINKVPAGYGYDDVCGKKAVEFLHKSYHKSFDQILHKVFTSGESSIFEHQSRVDNWRMSRVIPLSTGKNHIESAMIISTDITEMRQMQLSLIESELQYRDLIEQLAEGILILDDEGHIQYVNPTAEQIFQKTAAQLTGCLQKDFLKSIDEKAEIEITRSAKDTIIVESQTVKITWQNKTAYLVSLRDTTQTVALREKLKRLSFYDELTDLYNRRGFFDMLERQIKLSNRKGTKFFLLFADFDGLKEINDSLGHVTGDKALIDFALILKGCFRESDIIARIGGDEFSVFPIDADKKACELLLKRIDRTITAFNNKSKQSYRLSVSIGTAFYDPAQPCSPDDLLSRADAEMYKVKRMKKNNNI